jgi:hypothetical protein
MKCLERNECLLLALWNVLKEMNVYTVSMSQFVHVHTLNIFTRSINDSECIYLHVPSPYIFEII